MTKEELLKAQFKKKYCAKCKLEKFVKGFGLAKSGILKSVCNECEDREKNQNSRYQKTAGEYKAKSHGTEWMIGEGRRF